MHDDEWYRQLHGRLLAGDPIASTELAEVIWASLVREMERRYPQLKQSEHLRDAASDALISYIKNPAQFDPTKRGLPGYLIMAAAGDLRNALAKVSRRKLREVTTEDVELRRAAGKEREKRYLDVRTGPLETVAALTKLFKDPKDRQALELIVQGERSTEVFAKVWDLDSLSTKERARHVKRNKDRIKKMLRRHGRGDYGSNG
jgi:RNA polymerase sigma-70 factor (ECF subfamily)